MKEGINLASAYQKKFIPLEKIAALALETRPLIKLITTLSLFLLALILINVLLAVFLNRQLTQKADLSKRLSELTQQEKIVLATVQRQKDLESIKSQKKDFWSTVNLIKDNLPEDTVLNELNLTAGETVLSAQTPSGSSFSQFIANLVSAKFCREISLTSSTYAQRQDLFGFSLECLLTDSVNK